MRIGVLTQYVHRVGGVETYLERVVPALAEMGHEVVVWHEFAPPAESGHRFVGAHQSRMLSDRGEGTRSEWLRWNPGVVFLNGLSQPLLEARLTEGLPTVTFLHGYQGTCISGGKTFMFPSATPCSRTLGAGCLLRYYPRRCGGLNPVVMLDAYRQQQLRRRLLARSTLVATFSEHMRREAIAHGVDERRIVRMPPFDPTPRTLASRERAGQPARVHLAFVGRMERPKGAHMLLAALERLDAALRARLKVTFAGDGRERGRLERLAARLDGAEIVFTGWIDAAAREQLFAAVDLLVVPSIWPEPLGLVGIEAAAAGVPAVAFDVGGIGDWLEDAVTGRLVRGRPSARALAEAITAAVADPALLRGWGARARARAQRLTLATHVQALDSALRQAAGHAGAVPAAGAAH